MASTTRLNEDSDLDACPESVPLPPPWRQWWVMTAVAAIVAGAVLLAVFATVALSGKTPILASANGSMQLNQIVVQPRFEKCAKIKGGENCITQKCCQLTGYTCYEIHSGYAKCMKKCTPGVDGTCITQALLSSAQRSSITYSGTTLFCFSFYMKDTGSTKKSYDLELLRTNLFLGSSIFGCEAYRVFSDVSEWLSPGKVDTVKIDDVENNFHFAKRKFNGYWINSNIFIQIWRKIKEENMWSSKDWTVKTDADAVFLPMRLRKKLDSLEVTPNGIYLENCKYIHLGLHGCLEVLSHQAASTFMANLDDCKMSLNYLGREKLLHYEPWGEDVFVQRCMDLHGVDRVAAFDIAADALCKGYVPEDQKKNKHWRPDCAVTKTAALHPFMTPKEYFACLKATQR